MAEVTERRARRRRSLSPPLLEERNSRAVRSRSPLVAKTRHLDVPQLDYEIDSDDMRYDQSYSHNSSVGAESSVTHTASNAWMENRASVHNTGKYGIEQSIQSGVPQDSGKPSWIASTDNYRPPLGTRTNTYR